MPKIISFGFSSIRRWSHVRKGSHSAPFIISVRIFLEGIEVSFTTEGNAAPPKPTTPASLIKFNISSLDKPEISLAGIDSTVAFTSRPSDSIIIALELSIIGLGLSSIAITLPEILEWRLAEINPFACAINDPVLTLSPTLTMGSDGAPVCWDKSNIAFLGSGPIAIFLFFAISLKSGGCMKFIAAIFVYYT